MPKISKLNLDDRDPVLFDDYARFVDSLSSKDAKDTMSYLRNITEIATSGNCDTFSMLVSGSLGLARESGQSLEIIQSIMFGRKNMDPEAVDLLKRELGDIIFYWTQTCIALGLKPSEVIEDNQKRIMARQPHGFSHDNQRKRTISDL